MSEVAPAAPAPASTPSQPSAPTAANDNKEVPKPDAAPETTKAERHRIKVYGQEQDLSIDELKVLAQKGAGADKRFNEAAQLSKKAEALHKAYAEGDVATIKKLLGPDRFHKLATEHFKELLEEEEMSPQEKKLREREKSLKAKEEEHSKREKEENSRKQKALEDHYAERFDKEFTAAMTEAKLPRTPSTLKRMAEAMMVSLEHGLDLSAKEVAEVVRQDFHGATKEALLAMGDDLFDYLGPDVEEKFRKRSLSKVKNQFGGGADPKRESKEPPKKKIRDREAWKARLEEIKNGL